MTIATSHSDTLGRDIPVAAWTLLNICGADQQPHSGRTLADHLQGTHALLRAWGNPPAVCLAGLFHSIYGTNAFKHRSLGEADRPTLAQAIGEEAEWLAWVFAGIERPQAIIRAFERGLPTRMTRVAARQPAPALPFPLAPAQLCALAEIESANLLEQGGSRSSLRDLYCLSISCPGAISPAATATLRTVLGQALAHPARRAAP